MTIPTYKEDPEMYEGTGLYEVCVFCKKTTKYWHERTNNPVCESCAKDHKVSELHNWRKKYKGGKPMKWNEIPSFVTRGSYEVNIPLNYLEKNISEFESYDGLQLNPDFQRGHVWTKPQQERFVEYFLRGGQTGRIIYFNKPSWQCTKTTDYDDFVCVDGLQRITALRKFLANEIKAFGQFRDEFGEKIRLSLSVDNLKFNINNLQTKKEVLNWYIQLNSGGTDHTEEEINKVKSMLDKETES